MASAERDPDTLDLPRARAVVDNLHIALESSLPIAISIGIVMERLSLDREGAFATLRSISQFQHVKMRTLADHIIFSGEIPSAAAAGATR